jgi:flagellar basal-body rod protein FlgG
MDGIELMAGAMHAAQARLDVSASNLSNVSSTGFQRRVAHTILDERGLRVSSSVDRNQGPLERTGRAFDLAATGGSFFVRDAHGRAMAVRSASLTLDANGTLLDERGRALIGASGTLRASAGSTIDARGVVRDGGNVSGRLRLTSGAAVESGFLERSNVDAVREMVDVLSAQRAFETAQKTLSAIDETRSKDVNDVVRAKA